MKKNIALITSIPSENNYLPFHLTLQKILQDRFNVNMDLYRNGEFICFWDSGNKRILYHKQEFHPEQYNLALIRLAIKASHCGDHYILREFENCNIPVINPSQALGNARDKLHTLQSLSNNNIPMTPTVIVRTREQIDNALQILGEPPYIVKNCFGSGGRCVLQATTKAQVYSFFDYVWHIDRNEILMLQPYINTHPVSDVRALYFAGKLWRAMVRQASGEEFRANVKLGATTTPTTLTKEEDAICQKAVKITGLVLAGVDFLRTPSGMYLLEINGCPGLTGLAKAYAPKVSIIEELAELLYNY